MENTTRVKTPILATRVESTNPNLATPKVKNPNLATLVSNLNSDSRIKPIKTCALFRRIYQSYHLPIWKNNILEKIDTPLGVFASTESLKALEKLPDIDSSTLQQIRQLLANEVFRIARFISLVAQSENNLGLKDCQIQRNHGSHRPPTRVAFETSDGYKFLYCAGVSNINWMANNKFEAGLNVTEFAQKFPPHKKKVVHCYGDKIPKPKSAMVQEAERDLGCRKSEDLVDIEVLKAGFLHDK